LTPNARRLAPAVLIAVAATGAWLAHSAFDRYRRLPEIPPARPRPGVPSLTVVVPARNEAETLPTLLPSLRAEDYPDYEILVVDDASTDGTADIAQAHGARVLRTAGPPPGWTGKCHACWLGAQAAQGEWLLFTDADTEHGRLSLASSVRYALDHRADALSITLRQRCETFWERLLLPYAFQSLFAGLATEHLDDPSRADAMLNGQFILVRRDRYLEAGGHAAVRSSIIEDLALGRSLKAQGLRLVSGRGESLAAVRMYRDFASLREGFTKNAFAILEAVPARGWRAGTASTLGGLPALLLAGALLRRSRLAPAAAALAALMMFDFARWLGAFGIPRTYAILQPVAALTFQTISLPSVWRSVTGQGLAWKGRIYAGTNTGMAQTDQGNGMRDG
jgi:cellulose synthase/poly-beta-1,6-N-acetylglucosamine synthase-like glycosyltransferase